MFNHQTDRPDDLQEIAVAATISLIIVLLVAFFWHDVLLFLSGLWLALTGG